MNRVRFHIYFRLFFHSAEIWSLGGNDYLKICISCNIHTKILIYSHYRSQHNTKSMKPSAKYSQTIQILHSVNAIWMRCERWHLLFSSCKWFATHSHSTSKMRMHLEYSWESFPPSLLLFAIVCIQEIFTT